MKKLDIIIAAVIGVLACLSLVAYLLIYNIDKVEKIEVYYKNNLIYAQEIKEDTDIILKITSNKEDRIIVLEKIDYKTSLLIDTITIYNEKITDNIENEIAVKFDSVRMIHANCKNKSCMNMSITSHIFSPIICTNGITVKPSIKEIEIIV